MSSGHADRMTIPRPAALWSPSSAGQARTFEDYCAADPKGPAAQWVYDKASIGFVVSGWFEYASQDESRLAGPGSLILGNAGDPFSVRHTDANGNRRLVATLSEEVIEEAANHAGVAPRFNSSVIPPGASSTYASGLIRAASRGDDQAQYLLADALLSASQPPSPARITAADRTRVQNVVRHVEAHFDHPCSLALLADIAGVSRYHFVRIFSHVVGVTPNQYLIQVRMRAAADLLLTSKAPIAQVIFDVGFNDISYFYACFRETFRCTPRQWRFRH